MVAALQLLGLLPVLVWLLSPGPLDGGGIGVAAAKVMVLLFCGTLFFFLRSVINKRTPGLLKGSMSL